MKPARNTGTRPICPAARARQRGWAQIRVRVSSVAQLQQEEIALTAMGGRFVRGYVRHTVQG